MKFLKIMDDKQRTTMSRLKPAIAGLVLVLFGYIGIHSLKPVLGAETEIKMFSGTSASFSDSKINLETSRSLLRNGLPFLERKAGQDNRFIILNFNWTEFYWRLAGSIQDSRPLSIVQSQLPLLAIYKPNPVIPAADLTTGIDKQATLAAPDKSPAVPAVLESSGKPEVFIFHTHTTESYLPESGKAHSPNSQGDIVKVGAYLQKILAAKYGIMSLHCETIHDVYPFRDSYKRSQLSIRQYLENYPELKVVLDVHRDATPGIEASCFIQGEKTAKIRIVIGSDKMGLPHPNWRENLHFAKELENAMNLQFPGLCNGIVISDARYNQHLHTHAVIIEFGDQNSTLTEAYRASDCFAASLNTVLNQKKPEADKDIPL